ncbi:MAG: glycosyltransferase [Pseudomonadales bacterium]|nr:glycosyltransferase [Pseudomonadales bacterium]
MPDTHLLQKNGILLYDFLLVRGGAESVTLELLERLPGTDLCVEYYTPEFANDLTMLNVACRTLGAYTAIPGWQSIKGIFNFYVKTRFLVGYDWALYSGSNAPVAVHNQKQGRKYLYCHTIPRFAYDLEEYYIGRAQWWQYPLFLMLVRFVRWRYEAALSCMDVIVSNSENTRRRLKKYIGFDSIVIHPPVATDRFVWLGQGDYYLSTSRVESFKRVKLIVQAFCHMPESKLIVASGGTELAALRKLAADAPNIRFTGWITEQELQVLVGQAIATIYIPIDEDFGISPVESMAAGKPVIGVAQGGLLETIIPDRTGVLLPPDPTVEELCTAVQAMTAEVALSMRTACEEQAKLFGREVFVRKIGELLEMEQMTFHETEK